MANECPKCQTDNPPESKFCMECATPLPGIKEAVHTKTLETPTEELKRGSVFAGRYEIVEELGKGGMGKVYRVEDRKIKEEVALKLIKPEIASDKKIIERFTNELRTARKIGHRNVGRMYDIGEEKGSHYITMEYISGQDLKGLIRQSKRLSIPTAVAIAKEICEGLAEAHRLGIVHRDLKPSNIMVDKEGAARIMDFGIARTVKEKGITGSGIMIGTPEYMSPEQAEAKDVDHRSDIYSLGIILYEMVTGQLPFEGDTPLAIAMKHKGEAPQDPQLLNPNMPEGLSKVIMRCMEKDRVVRYESAMAVFYDLAKIEAGLPTTEKIGLKRKSITAQDITVTFNVKKLAVPILIVVALIVGAFVLVKIFGGRKDAPLALSSSGKPSIAVMYFENQTDMAGLDKMLVRLLITNLSRYDNIEVMSSQRLFDLLKLLGKQDAQAIDVSLATDVATKAGIETMLLGSIIQIGGHIRLVSELYNVKNGSIIGTQTADGASYDDVFDMLDSITEQVGKQIGATATKGRLKVTDVTTPSLLAQDRYQKGYDLILRWDNRGAVKYLQEAVELDPTFAIAYAYLGMVQIGGMMSILDLYTDLSKGRESLNLAKKYMGQASPNEQLIIQMIDGLLNRNLTKAAEFGELLLARKVPERWAFYSIGMDQFFKQDFGAAVQTFEKALENDRTDGLSYNLLGYSYAFLGEYQQAISAMRTYIAVDPDVWAPYDGAWELSMWAGKYDEAIEYADEAMRVLPTRTWFNDLAGMALVHKGQGEAARERFNRRAQYPVSNIYLGLSYLTEGRHQDAQAKFLQACDKTPERGYYRRVLGEALLIQGKFDEALVQFLEAEKLRSEEYSSDFNPIPLERRFYTGRVYIKQGDIDKATTAAQEMSGIIKKQGLESAFLDFHYLLRAEIAMNQNRPEEALSLLEQTSTYSWNFSPFYWRMKAAAEEALDRYDAAVKSYQVFDGFITLSRQCLRDSVRYFYEQSMLDYNLGRIAEKKNDVDSAIDHYLKFLEGMKNADPGLPKVDDARKRLAGLRE